MKLDNLKSLDLLPRFAQQSGCAQAICAVLDRYLCARDDGHYENTRGFAARVQALTCELSTWPYCLSTDELKESFDTIGLFHWYPDLNNENLIKVNGLAVECAPYSISGRHAAAFCEVFYTTGAVWFEPLPMAANPGGGNYYMFIEGVHKGGHLELSRSLNELYHVTRASKVLRRIQQTAEGNAQKSVNVYSGDVYQYTQQTITHTGD